MEVSADNSFPDFRSPFPAPRSLLPVLVTSGRFLGAGPLKTLDKGEQAFSHSHWDAKKGEVEGTLIPPPPNISAVV